MHKRIPGICESCGKNPAISPMAKPPFSVEILFLAHQVPQKRHKDWQRRPKTFETVFQLQMLPACQQLVALVQSSAPGGAKNCTGGNNKVGRFLEPSNFASIQSWRRMGRVISKLDQPAERSENDATCISVNFAGSFDLDLRDICSPDGPASCVHEKSLLMAELLRWVESDCKDTPKHHHLDWFHPW